MQRRGPSIFFFNDTATTEIYTLSLHDALPILGGYPEWLDYCEDLVFDLAPQNAGHRFGFARSEEHTSELQSRQYLVCRLLLEKKKTHAVKHPLRYTHTPRKRSRLDHTRLRLTD